MRKSLVLLISATLVAVLAFGAAGAFAKEVTITYNHGRDATGVTKKLIAQFMARYPDIKVNEGRGHHLAGGIRRGAVGIAVEQVLLKARVG